MRFHVNIILTSLLEDTLFISSLFKATFLQQKLQYSCCMQQGQDTPSVLIRAVPCHTIL
jgi:hypothetical protein